MRGSVSISVVVGSDYAGAVESPSLLSCWFMVVFDRRL